MTYGLSELLWEETCELLSETSTGISNQMQSVGRRALGLRYGSHNRCRAVVWALRDPGLQIKNYLLKSVIDPMLCNDDLVVYGNLAFLDRDSLEISLKTCTSSNNQRSLSRYQVDPRRLLSHNVGTDRRQARLAASIMCDKVTARRCESRTPRGTQRLC